MTDTEIINWLEEALVRMDTRGGDWLQVIEDEIIANPNTTLRAAVIIAKQKADRILEANQRRRLIEDNTELIILWMNQTDRGGKCAIISGIMNEFNLQKLREANTRLRSVLGAHNLSNDDIYTWNYDGGN